MELYHVDIRLPDGFRLPNGQRELVWSKHAKRAAETDRYGHIPIIPLINPSMWRPIEVEMDNGKVTKIVMRTEWSYDTDLVLVVIPKNPDPWFVKTCWLNDANDHHHTLDVSAYVH